MASRTACFCFILGNLYTFSPQDSLDTLSTSVTPHLGQITLGPNKLNIWTCVRFTDVHMCNMEFMMGRAVSDSEEAKSSPTRQTTASVLRSLRSTCCDTELQPDIPESKLLTLKLQKQAVRKMTAIARREELRWCLRLSRQNESRRIDCARESEFDSVD